MQKKKGHIGAALARAAWQSVAGGNCQCQKLWACAEAGARVYSCRLGLLLAAPVGRGFGHPEGAVVAVQNCGCPGVGALTHVADAVCTQTMPGGLGNAVMGPAMLQRFSVHSACNVWPCAHGWALNMSLSLSAACQGNWTPCVGRLGCSGN